MQIGRLLAPQAGRQSSLGQTLARVMRVDGDSIATVDRDHRQTWSAYGERVSRLAGALRRLGLRDGERVAILSNNSHRYLEIYHAVPWAGAIFAPLNFRLAAPEQAAILADCGARILIADNDHLERASQLAHGLPDLRLLHAGDAAAPAGWLSYERLIDEAAPAPDACRAGDDVAALFYTSGSTGRPKGVMHTHANLVASAIAYAAAIGLSEESVALISGPLFHVGAAGLAVPAMVSGGRVVVLSRFEPAQVLRLIEQERATVTSVVPTMLRMLVDHPNAARHDLSSLRTLLYGAAPMPETLVSQAREHFTRTEFTHCYGMTESTASVSVLPSRYVMPTHRHLDKWRSAGRAILGTDLAIVDAQDQVLPPGATLSAESIIAHCRGLIASYKCPRSVDVRDTALPLSGTNKIDKPALRAPYWAGRSSRLV